MTTNLSRRSHHFALRATARAARWPLPGLPSAVAPSTDVADALAMVADCLACAAAGRQLSTAYSLTDYSDAPWAVLA